MSKISAELTLAKSATKVCFPPFVTYAVTIGDDCVGNSANFLRSCNKRPLLFDAELNSISGFTWKAWNRRSSVC